MDNMGYRRKIWGNMGKYLRKYGIVAGTEKKKGETTDPDLLVPAESASHTKILFGICKGGSMLWPVWQLVHVNKWMFIPITSGI